MRIRDSPIRTPANQISFLHSAKFQENKLATLNFVQDKNKSTRIQFQTMRVDRKSSEDRQGDATSNRTSMLKKSEFFFRKNDSVSNDKTRSKGGSGNNNKQSVWLTEFCSSFMNSFIHKEQVGQQQKERKSEMVKVACIKLFKGGEVLPLQESNQQARPKKEMSLTPVLESKVRVNEKYSDQNGDKSANDRRDKAVFDKISVFKIESILESLKHKAGEPKNSFNLSFQQNEAQPKKKQEAPKDQERESEFVMHSKLGNESKEQFVNEFCIPKSYLGASKRTQSEKSFQKVECVKPVVAKVQERFKSQQSQSHLYYFSTVVSAFQSQNENSSTKLIKKNFASLLQGVKIAQSCLQQSAQSVQYRQRMVILPKVKKDTRTIVFDMDETLIHCNDDSATPGDILLPVTFDDGQRMDASINIRPYVYHLFQNLYKHFEIIIFTASHQSYANVIIDYLDPERKYVSHRLFRENCIPTNEGAYIKDLRVLGNRNLSNVLLVDNEACSFAYQLDNAVPILPYYGNKQDQVTNSLIHFSKELKHLLSYLLKFKTADNIKDLNKNLLNLEKLGKYEDPKEALQNEYSSYFE